MRAKRILLRSSAAKPLTPNPADVNNRLEYLDWRRNGVWHNAIPVGKNAVLSNVRARDLRVVRSVAERLKVSE
jgi:hypothetical protein